MATFTLVLYPSYVHAYVLMHTYTRAYAYGLILKLLQYGSLYYDSDYTASHLIVFLHLGSSNLGQVSYSATVHGMDRR